MKINVNKIFQKSYIIFSKKAQEIKINFRIKIE